MKYPPPPKNYPGSTPTYGTHFIKQNLAASPASPVFTPMCALLS